MTAFKVGPDAAMAKAIRDLIEQAQLAYQFSPNSYTMSALNAALAVEQAEQRRMEVEGQEITDAEEIGALFDAALARDDLEPRSVTFIRNIHAFWEKFGYVTVRQFVAVQRIVALEGDAAR
jgi:hypothetical protein